MGNLGSTPGPANRAELGRALSSVQNRRLKARIHILNPVHRPCTKEEIEPLGTMPDHDLARLLLLAQGH
jgi:hypothetical protein